MNLFCENLNRLFAEVTKHDGQLYSDVEVEVATSNAGCRITQTYIQRLRNGISQNPSYDKMIALARFFGVHPGYFFDDHSGEGESTFAVPNQAGQILPIKNIAMRAEGIGDANLKHLLVDMVAAINNIQERDQVKGSKQEKVVSRPKKKISK